MGTGLIGLWENKSHLLYLSHLGADPGNQLGSQLEATVRISRVIRERMISCKIDAAGPGNRGLQGLQEAVLRYASLPVETAAQETAAFAQRGE